MGALFARLVTATALLAACGGPESDTAGDAGLADGGNDAALSRPDIPWFTEGVPPIAPPALTPCPEGWREIAPAEPGDVATCDPYPEGGALECPLGHAHFPGEPGCAPVGSPCPAGDWAEGLADDGTVLFVRAGASGGDGTRTRPFGTIADAMAAARDGSTIALAKGRYAERVALARLGTIVRGACSAETVVTHVGSSASVEIAAPRTTVRDIAIADNDDAGIFVHGTSTDATIDGILVSNARSVGISVQGGANLVARSLVVRGTREHESGELGIGLHVERGASVELSRAVIERNHMFGVYAVAGAHVVLRDIVVRDTSPRRRDGLFGRGIQIDRASIAEVSKFLVELNHEIGIMVWAEGSVLSLSDGVVRDTRPDPTFGTNGRGLVVQGRDVTAAVTRVVFERNTDIGVMVTQPSTHLAMSDVVIRDTQPRPADGQSGRGIELHTDASMQATRLVLERNHQIALFAAGESTHVVMTDAIVRDTMPDAAFGYGGGGLQAQDGAAVELASVLIDRSHEIGLSAFREGTTLVATDVVVRDTRPRACAETTCRGFGAGMGGVSHMGTLHLTRFLITRSALCGLQIAYDGQVDLRAGEISENEFGVCLQVDGYDVARLSDAVVYRDNGAPLAATTLPVPEPIAPTL